MIRHSVTACAFLAVLAAGCKSPQGGRDLATNTLICPRTHFATSAPGDRAIFILPVRDARDVSALPASNGNCPVIYDSDARWERPVRAMVEQLLREELDGSGLFAAITPKARPADLLLQPTLLRFDSGVVETIEGGRSLAVVSLRLQIFGPEDAPGSRPVWFDRTFGDTQISGVALVPMSTLLLSGHTVQSTMMQAVAALDGSNVGRTGMPLEPVKPEPAPVAPAPVESSGITTSR
jgi:hypothetical protein